MYVAQFAFFEHKRVGGNDAIALPLKLALQYRHIGSRPPYGKFLSRGIPLVDALLP